MESEKVYMVLYFDEKQSIKFTIKPNNIEQIVFRKLTLDECNELYISKPNNFAIDIVAKGNHIYSIYYLEYNQGLNMYDTIETLRACGDEILLNFDSYKPFSVQCKE